MSAIYTIQCYTGSNEGTFYIQSKGLHAGRPLRDPIRNCFAVTTIEPLLFERVYSLYIGKYFDFYIGGSVVPFIRICDVRKVIDTALEQQPQFREKELTAIKTIDQLLLNLDKQLEMYKQMQFALCHKINISSK